MIVVEGKLYKNLGLYEWFKDRPPMEDWIVYGDFLLEKLADEERRKADRRRKAGRWAGADRRKADRRIEYQARSLNIIPVPAY
jgi:hypothetical protein